MDRRAPRLKRSIYSRVTPCFNHAGQWLYTEIVRKGSKVICMAKNAVYASFDSLYDTADQELKRAALMFQKVFVPKLSSIPPEKDFIKYTAPKEFTDLIKENDALNEYLIEQGVIAPYEIPYFPDIGSLTELERQWLRYSIYCTTKAYSIFRMTGLPKGPREQERGWVISQDMVERSNDAMTRYHALGLAKNSSEEFYPILRSTESFHKVGSKTQVVRLLLNHIPQPTPDTPWEAIIDFRRDESTRLKYLALMNWINELSSSSLTVNELNEKLEYLYLDYKRSFERHRLKATTGILEIIAGAAIGFFTSNVPAALNLASNILKVSSTALSLHQEEEKLPGKEIAYIYHANKTFCAGRSPRSLNCGR